MKKGKRLGNIVSNIYLILLSVFAVFPLLWLLVSSFKSSSEMLNNPTRIFPIDWTLENFKTVLITLNFTINICNSVIIAAATTVVAIIISSLAAYGVVRFFPKLGDLMTKILVTTYMFPSIMLVIPYAMVMAKLGLTNTRVGLVLVYLSFSVPYAVWMLVGFFKTVPIGIEEAARIDGANKMQVFVRVVLPLVAPGIVSTAIYVFINAWKRIPLLHDPDEQFRQDHHLGGGQDAGRRGHPELGFPDGSLCHRRCPVHHLLLLHPEQAGRRPFRRRGQVKTSTPTLILNRRMLL